MLLTYNFVACVRSSLRSAARPEAALARPVSGEIGRLDAVAVSRPAAVTDGGVAQRVRQSVRRSTLYNSMYNSMLMLSRPNLDAHIDALGHVDVLGWTSTGGPKSAAGAAAMGRGRGEQVSAR